MGIKNIEALFPGDDTPSVGAELNLAVLGNGVFSIAGNNSVVHNTDANHIQITSRYVIDNGDGSYTAMTG